MVVSPRDAQGSGPTQAPRAPALVGETPPEVIWHDLECGSYHADLPLWRKLAAGCSAPILDVGAGTGRVALELARAGHSVTALDRDPVLLGALRERAKDLDVEIVCADARSFELGRREFGLCVVPMQTIQLLGGAAERVAFLRRARAHLRHGALIACAILSELEPFDCAKGDAAPSPETARVDGLLHVSCARRVSVLRRSVLIERERRILPAGDCEGDGALAGPPPVEHPCERHVVELSRVSVRELEREAIEAGLLPQPAREVARTEDYVGSAVVMLRA